ncbi:hypothetical protein RJ641_031816 [Dillenia turbinata]|uniref:DUF7912 domain-containing protein n=1 Tax=Dillenia turbinata TaxID=194707 RepID=A0AAN8W1N7_9MAGN
MAFGPTLRLKDFKLSASAITISGLSYRRIQQTRNLTSITFLAYPIPIRSFRNKSFAIQAKKKDSGSEPVLKPTFIKEVTMDDEEEEEEDILFDEFEDDDGGDDYFEEEFLDDDAGLYAGDGAGGGGISLAGTWWDKEALAIAEEVALSLDGAIRIYAFKTLTNSTIKVRIETLSNKSGSPSMNDIEAFTLAYRAKLEDAEAAKLILEDITLEVSSPGVERVVRVPLELERFQDRAMYVKYVNEADSPDTSSKESDGVFKLISFDLISNSCTWGLADVRLNREKAGKGRPLSKKQREWRLTTPFDSLRLVRLYSEA